MLNNEIQIVLDLMLEISRISDQDHLSLYKSQQIIDLIIDIIPERLLTKRNVQ